MFIDIRVTRKQVVADARDISWRDVAVFSLIDLRGFISAL